MPLATGIASSFSAVRVKMVKYDRGEEKCCRKQARKARNSRRRRFPVSLLFPTAASTSMGKARRRGSTEQLLSAIPRVFKARGTTL